MSPGWLCVASARCRLPGGHTRHGDCQPFVSQDETHVLGPLLGSNASRSASQGSSLRATNALQRSDRSQRGNVGEREVYLQRRKSAPPQRPAPLRQLITEPGDNAGVGRRGGEGGTGCADVSPEHPAFYGPSDELTWQPQQRPSTCRT